MTTEIDATGRSTPALLDRPTSESLTSEAIQIFLNDFPETNRLIGKREFDPERIQTAIKYCISEWNETPPLLTTFSDKNFPYKTTLLYGVAGWLLLGESIFQERNNLTYQSGGITVQDDDNAQAYFNFANFLRTEFKQKMMQQKMAENLRRGWGTVRSDYGTLGFRG